MYDVASLRKKNMLNLKQKNTGLGATYVSHLEKKICIVIEVATMRVLATN